MFHVKQKANAMALDDFIADMGRRYDIEEAHKRSVVAELERLRIKLTYEQAMLLFRMGDGTFRTMELVNRKICRGANPSYNLKKLYAKKLIEEVPETGGDARARHVTATAKGREIGNTVREFFRRQYEDMTKSGYYQQDIQQAAFAGNALVARFLNDWNKYQR